MELRDCYLSTTKYAKHLSAIYKIKHEHEKGCPVLIDSGAAGTIVGSKWAQSWDDQWENKTAPSANSFRFGDSKVYKSLGKLLITTFLTQHTSTESIPVTFETDVVDCEVPMLISLPALENMQAKIDFTNLTLTTPSFDHKLIREGAGHLRLQLENNPIIVDPYTLSKDFNKTAPIKDPPEKHTTTSDHTEVGNKRVFISHENPESNGNRPEQLTTITPEQIKKLHLQFNHALAPAMIKIIKAANMKAEEDHIHTVIENCGCHVPHNRPQKTKVSGARAQFPGQVIHLDVFFPSLTNPQKNPFLMIVDSFSRFTMTRKVFEPW